MTYTGLELIAYFLIYSLIGWILEVCIVAVRERRFRNKGFINLPFVFMYGAIMDILIVMWPYIGENVAFKFIAVFAVFVVVQALSEVVTRNICHKMLLKYEDITPYNGTWRNLIVALLMSAAIWAMMEVLHPLMYIPVTLIPELALKIICAIVISIIVIDLLLTLYVMFKGRKSREVHEFREKQSDYHDEINGHIYKFIWGRLEKAYPNLETDPDAEKNYIFADGICLDKLIWVFLVSAFLGDLIEMVFCRITGGVWMSRSSVLYGSFSIVWGLGAVVLTIVLSRFKDKEDRYIFLIGALLGGVYEYVCSLFTEIVFGTVFWDYSWMPFNIGGRTNLLYMIFWGILSVGWIKIAYPKMSNGIEKVPPLIGKIVTWVLVIFMMCNALVSGMAMIRYTERQDDIQAENAIEEFMDVHYDDALIEKVWPNMKITQ